MVFKLSEHKEKPDHMIRLFILNNVKQDFVPVVLGHIEHGVHVLAFYPYRSVEYCRQRSHGQGSAISQFCPYSSLRHLVQ